MQLPRLIIVGASGFLGRHLLAALRKGHRIYAIARRSPQESGAPIHRNITWYQADIADKERVASVFRCVRESGPIDAVLHFAAHYDFSGEEHAEYFRTNVEGLGNVLELCKELELRRFVFTSSVAASRFPPPGGALTESCTPDGKHIYARTKCIGEKVVQQYASCFPTCVVRLGALYSDWCEYPPLFMFINTWLSTSWRARIVAGRGKSAIPYLHIRDGVAFFRRLLEQEARIDPGQIIIASTDEPISHRQLFEAATLEHRGRKAKPLLIPKLISRIGLRVMDFVGRLLGQRPFERPWMGEYIDLEMRVDASHTRKLLDWSPNPRLEIVRRMPFIIENRKTDPIEWNRKNTAAMTVHLSTHLRMFQVIEANEHELVGASVARCLSRDAQNRFPSYQRLPEEELHWAAQQTVLHLKNAVRMREKAIFRAHCREIAERRFRQGFQCEEVVGIIQLKEEICMDILRADPHLAGEDELLHDYVEMTFRLGIDEVFDTFEELSGHFIPLESARLG